MKSASFVQSTLAHGFLQAHPFSSFSKVHRTRSTIRTQTLFEPRTVTSFNADAKSTWIKPGENTKSEANTTELHKSAFRPRQSLCSKRFRSDSIGHSLYSSLFTPFIRTQIQ
ncbi:hypothetical protein Mapa_016020 [Marchantia paleacea]|nr:hypothetical protein Mapa_016020 [Marchantia paleacea]